MKKLLLFPLLLCLALLAKAQTYPVDTILYNGDINQRINIVILGDGFLATEMTRFDSMAQVVTDALFAEVPFTQYQPYFNVFTIQAPSNESGASHPGTATDVNEPVFAVDTVYNIYGSSFDAFGIHRLLVPFSGNSINTVLANNFPSYDQIIILVNTENYGGSGGTYSTSSLASSALEIALHELGHSFAGLADEYYAGDQYAGEKINMTAVNDTALVKWSHFIGVPNNGIGIYQHCCGGQSANWYRPHQNCKMRYLGRPFCAVCAEGIVEEIHDRVSPLNGFSPTANPSNPTYPLTLKVELTQPNPNTLKTVWDIDNTITANLQDSLIIQTSDLLPGPNTIRCIIQDTTEIIGNPNHSNLHIETVTWTLNKTAVSNALRQHFDFSVYPNPNNGIIKVGLNSDQNAAVSLVLTDLQGREIQQHKLETGQEFEMDLGDLPAGAYVLSFFAEGSRLASKKIFRQ